MRLTKGGPLIPVTITLHQVIDPETGEEKTLVVQGFESFFI